MQAVQAKHAARPSEKSGKGVNKPEFICPQLKRLG
jgi:hypothetical protein